VAVAELQQPPHRGQRGRQRVKRARRRRPLPRPCRP
jgi:hypothetical protein